MQVIMVGPAGVVDPIVRLVGLTIGHQAGRVVGEDRMILHRLNL